MGHSREKQCMPLKNVLGAASLMWQLDFFPWEPNRENRSGVILKVAFGIESQVVDSGFEYHVAPKLIIMVISFD